MAPDTPKSGDGVTQCKNDGFLLHSFNEKISGLLYIRDLISVQKKFPAADSAGGGKFYCLEAIFYCGISGTKRCSSEPRL